MGTATRRSSGLLGVAVCGEDDVAGDGAFGDADDGAGGAAEREGDGDIADRCLRRSAPLACSAEPRSSTSPPGMAARGWSESRCGAWVFASMQERTHRFSSVARCGGNRKLEPAGEGEAADEGEEAGGDVVQHDAGAGGEGFEPADGPGLPDVEEAEEDEGEEGVGPVGAHGDEGEPLAGDLVDDDEAGVFAAGFAGDDGCGGDADERGEDAAAAVAKAELRDAWDGRRVRRRTRGASAATEP